VKNVTIAGGITKDAIVRRTGDGEPVCGFSVAVDDRQGREKTTLYFDVSLWGKRGETLAQYLTKGSKVSVSGDLSKREHDGKTYLTIRADQVTLMGGGERRDDTPPRDYAPDQKAPAGRAGDMEDGSEIPF
jgi:single-strand DNA-binding protein